MNSLLLASFGSVMTYVGYIAIAILILLVMITVHEFGHYIVGKIFKFGIDEFAIGFGPKIFKKVKKNGEIFSIRLFHWSLLKWFNYRLQLQFAMNLNLRPFALLPQSLELKVQGFRNF